MRQPDQSCIFARWNGYHKIARHYKWALDETFNAGFEYLIIVEGYNEVFELIPSIRTNCLNLAHSKCDPNCTTYVSDDLNVSPDFYEYFLGTLELLKNDSTLWCISAWNDNGQTKNIDLSKPELLYRTDFFPGLGWMLHRNIWNELSAKWPKTYIGTNIPIDTNFICRHYIDFLLLSEHFFN